MPLTAVPLVVVICPTSITYLDPAPLSSAGSDDVVVLYGHLDKQPEMEGWRDGLGPWTPVLAAGRWADEHARRGLG